MLSVACAGEWVGREQLDPTLVDLLREEIYQLEKEIADIQKSCEHEFVGVGPPPELKESLVSGVYIGDVERVFVQGLSESGRSFRLVCKKCSLERKVVIWQTCPRCFSAMEKIDRLRQRRNFLGTEYMYYAIQLCRCPECGFTVACDVWDR